jgi:hypothetical protein
VADHIDRLIADLALVYFQPGHKTVTCAQDVSDALLARSREPEHPPVTMVTWGRELVSLFAVPVLVIPHYEPGRCESALGVQVVEVHPDGQP